MSLSNERAADEKATEAPTRHRWDAIHISILALVVIVVLLVGLVAFQRIRGPQASQKFCAGVGLMGPAASSPDAALAAWLVTSPASGSPNDWERTDGFGSDTTTSVEYEPIDPAGHRYHLVYASLIRGSWSIQGACV